MHQKNKCYLLLVFLLVPYASYAAPPCSKWLAKIISVQGKVDTQPSGKSVWQTVDQNKTFCTGDKIRISKHSRATIQMSNQSRITLDQGSTMVFLTPKQKSSPWFLNLLKGTAFFRSRQPQQLNVETPFINAVHEGTEFLVSVNSYQTEITVFDGQVAATNGLGEIHIKKGFTGIANKSKPPHIKPLTIRPEDAVQWTLYYPPIIDLQNNGLTRLNNDPQGNIHKSLALLDKNQDLQHNVNYLSYIASLLLSVGSVDEALAFIDKVQTLEPGDSDAMALLAIIAVTKNQQDNAFVLALKAVTLNSQSATAQIALSYAYQSLFKIELALKATEKAVHLSSKNALAWARLSELQLSSGERSNALESAQKALQLNPELAHTQTILGFAYLAEINTDEANTAFTKAIKLNSAAPLARLGLGLAKIRKGNVEEGIQDLETAVSLDPDNAIMRSYLGKAHYELKNDSFSATELAIAKEMDPKDPTPWFYDAILKQTTNRPIEALYDMQKAIELNDNRAIYRSSLLLDEDLAARTANLARIYQDLEFDRKALVEAWKSSNFDRSNYSTHRFLSDAYLNSSRHNITSNSELLQSQLLQPLNLSPIQPQQSGVNALVLNDSGVSNLSLNEFNPLFLSNGAHLVANGFFGSNDTWAENVIVSGIWNKLSASFGQFHYQTNAKTEAFPKNKDLKRDVYSVFAQYAITPKLNVQIEFKTEDITSGDIASHINNLKTDGFFKDEQRFLGERIEQDTIRVGGHYQHNAHNDFILSAIYTTFSERELTGLTINENATSQKGYQVEGQQLFRYKSIDTQTGLGYSHLKVSSAIPTKQLNGYLYINSKPFDWLSTTLGLSVDSYEDFSIKRNQINPKVGVFLMPSSKLLIRGAFFRSLKRSLITNQTIEPTQLSGFNQFYDDINGTSAWNYGVGFDYQFTKKISVGTEISWRRINKPLINIAQRQTFFEEHNETNGVAYLYWTPSKNIATSVEYKLEHFKRSFTSGAFDSFNPEGITNHIVPFSINFFSPSGVFLKFGGNYVNQDVKFVTEKGDIPIKGDLFKEKSDFWVFNSSIGYRLPKRLGLVSFEMKNIFNNDFKFQSSFNAFAKTQPEYFPERQLFLNLRLTL